MSNTYKGQFTEWSPAYPVVFHSFGSDKYDDTDFNHPIIAVETLKTHNITINAINKAMKK